MMRDPTPLAIAICAVLAVAFVWAANKWGTSLCTRTKRRRRVDTLGGYQGCNKGVRKAADGAAAAKRLEKDFVTTKGDKK